MMKLPPLDRLRRFASLLGWSNLRKHVHIVERWQEVGIRRVVWYESGDIDSVLFQINIMPELRAAVYAPRYGLCSLWHPFVLRKPLSRLQQEAQRLEPWLHRRWFDDLKGRRAYRAAHPECAGYTARRLGEAGRLHPIHEATSRGRPAS